VRTVGLFTTEPAAQVRRQQAELGLDLVQIVNEDPAEGWQAYAGLPLLRAFRVRGPESLAALAAVRGQTFLLDAYVPGVAGGTGESFDWRLARRAAAYGRVVLAGGLTPETVAGAIAAAQPWAVDVSSGIECRRGVKDHGRMRAFAAAVRGA
jgi:phosphoribosylanthranilate isomerase